MGANAPTQRMGSQEPLQGVGRNEGVGVAFLKANWHTEGPNHVGGVFREARLKAHGKGYRL